MTEGTKPDSPEWPNKNDIPDGVVPVSEVSQIPDLFKAFEDDLDLEMED